MSESDRPNARPDKSANSRPPRHSGEAVSQESRSEGKSASDKRKSPSESDIIAELGDELGGPA
jgi:hypothetical protein